MSLDNDPALAEIDRPELREKFKKLFRPEIRAINRNYRDNSKVIHAQFLSELDREEAHDRILNMCISPFYRKEGLSRLRQLGWDFLRTDPLSEKGAKNFDFLLYNQNAGPTAILGEVKSRVTSSVQIVNEVLEKAKIVEEHVDYISQEYLGQKKPPFFEWVIAIPADYGVEMMNAIEGVESREIILWQAIIDKMTLKLGQPRKKSILHHDREINRMLKEGLKVEANSADFFPNSHPVTKVQTLQNKYNVTRDGLIVDLEDLRRHVAGQLFYLDNASIEREVSFIVQEAQRIEFATRMLDHPGLRLVTRSKDNGRIRTELVNLWVRKKAGEEKEKEIERARQKTLRSIKEEESHSPPISNWMPDEKQP